MVDVDVSISSHLKEELTWAIYKWFWLISTIMLFKNSKSTKELRIKSFLIQNNIVYVAMWALVTYSN